MNNNQCGAGGGNCGKKNPLKMAVPVIAVFAILFVFDWLYHGQFMMPKYQATASVWRPMEEMQGFMWVCLLSKFLTAMVITCLYCCMAKGSECCGKCPKTGMKFGLAIGLLLGLQQWASVIWLPVPMEIPVYWLVGDIIKGVIIGVALAYLKAMCKDSGEGGSCSTGKGA